MEDEELQDQAAARLEMAARLLSLLYAVVSILWLIWVLVPGHQRKLAMMRAAKMTERSAWRTASRAGQQAMALELSGRGTSYSIPYGLSLLAGQAGRAYEKLRSS